MLLVKKASSCMRPVEEDEPEQEAAQREIEEEIGIKAS